jgi:CDP-glycerol glycerophosphotransferase (TagB/SpsB family)
LPGFTYEGVNIEVFQLHSIDALKSLASAGVIITTYSLHAMFGYRRLVNNSQRKIIQLWHGVPIKKIGSFIQSEKWWPYESERYHCLPASSKDDQITMARSFFNGDTTKVILSGLPRHDFLSISDDDLPTDYRRFQDLIINRCDGKRMILFAPTWRENPKDNLKFTFNQLNEIIYLMKEYDWVFAYRLHPNSLAQSTVDLFSMVSDQLIDVNDIPDSNVLLRYASGIITDYSSIYIDYMKLKRPVLLYTPDLEGYERQFNYSYEEFSPHERISTFEEFIGKLEYIVSGKYVLDEQYQKVLRRFHEYELDNLNSIRLLNQLKLLPGGDK